MYLISAYISSLGLQSTKYAINHTDLPVFTIRCPLIMETTKIVLTLTISNRDEEQLSRAMASLTAKPAILWVPWRMYKIGE